jgi:hypothetical protein
MSSSNELKGRIVQFAAAFYSKHQDAPSIRAILEHLRLNRTTFYSLFPSGLSELCAFAKLPVPHHRIQAVQEALRTRLASEEKETSELQQLPPQYSRSTSEVTRSVYGTYTIERNAQPYLVIHRPPDLDPGRQHQRAEQENLRSTPEIIPYEDIRASIRGRGKSATNQ